MIGRSILICGASGQVGQTLTERLRQTGRDVVAFDRRALDIADSARVNQVLSTSRPSVVVNAAAYTAVDQAESEPEVAHAVNAEAPRQLALACVNVDAALLSYSTEYVFDGTKAAPYTESDPVAPLNVYGRSKVLGEDGIRASLERHVILRTSWVFAPGRSNFVTTILRLGLERGTLRVTDEEFGCPTPAGDIAEVSVALIEAMEKNRDMPWGTYHFCGAGPVSRYDFAVAIVREAAATTGLTIDVVPIKSVEYPTPAKRPLNAVLDCGKIARVFGRTQPDWRDPLAQTVREFHCNRMVGR
ncbi:MAG: dTDP-4-dehydrorhamnose reductase [Rhodospirillales bacterium]|nr:dTDP-4-dehydrorhamnose reductase [Rhodospirillales bacterium]